MDGWIYRMVIPNFDNLKDELVEAIKDQVGHNINWTRREVVPGICELISEPLNGTVAGEVGQKLLALGIQCSSEDLSDQYMHVATNAPESYDYGYTVPLGYTSQGEFGTERHVAVQKERQQYQLGRYRSGLHQWRVIE